WDRGVGALIAGIVCLPRFADVTIPSMGDVFSGARSMAEGFNTHDGAHALASFLERYPRALILTGAGLSTASGIPDYRDRDGVRRGRLPIQGPEFRRELAIQRRYWARSMVGWPLLARAAPNAGHRALAAL